MSTTLATGINPDTGEIGYFVPAGAGYSVKSAEQQRISRDYYAKEQAKARRLGRRWIACYHDTIRSITNDLSLTEAGALIRLLPYLRFKSGGRLLENGKPLRQADIQRVINRSKANTSKILKRLVALGVVDEEAAGRTKIYSISLEFHAFGDVQDGVKFTKLYQYHANELTRDLDLNEIGLLYKILPYFHYATFYLCDSPDEPDEGAIAHLTREQLAERIGHEPETVSRYVGRLQSKGVIMSTKSMNSVNYIVHPDVMYRKEVEDVDYTEGVRRLFAQHARRVRPM